MTRQRLTGLAATLAIALFVAGIPLILIAIGAAPWDLNASGLPGTLTSRDDGTLALTLLTVVVWIAWAVVAATLLAETVATIRGVRLPTLPGLATPQAAASRLVAIAALAFVVAPGAVATLPTPPARATAPAPAADTTAPASATAPAPVDTKPKPKVEHPVATADYTTKRGDSLWKIAERLLGDGTRYSELIDLNRDILGNRPDFIPVGLVLRVPDTSAVTPASSAARSYMVVEGDTLWDIAARELGDPERYPEIVDASRDIAQPDGARLTDPGLIRPGWTLTLPAATPQGSPAPAPTAAADPTPHLLEPNLIPEEPVKAPRSIDHTTETTTGAESAPDHAAVGTAESASPGWLIPGLTAGGTVLAGCVFLTLRAHRRTQLRYRKPGQVLAPTPTDLRPMEKTAVAEGADIADTLEFLDRALRHLTAELKSQHEPTPSLTRVTLNSSTMTIDLAHPAELAAPWTGSGTQWTITTDTSVPDDNVIAPYPLLVSIGQNDTGDLELVNLEHFATINLTGDPERVEALGRHLAVELALSPWSALVEVHTVGFGTELDGLDDLRLQHHTNTDTTELAQVRRDVRASHDAGAGDPDPYRAIITTNANAVDLTDLRDLVSASGPRLGVAVVTLADEPGGAALTLDVDALGRLRNETLGLDLQAAGLTRAEATTCAAIVDLTRETEPVPIPVFEQAADGLNSLIDQAGALREELTDVRDTDPAGEGSLLPDRTEEYVEAAATTAEDVELIAPIVTAHVSQAVLDADPMLDDDLAKWRDRNCGLPKLTLLGPVELTAHGTAIPTARRQPVLTELVAYIALHPQGVVSRELSEVFLRSESRMRNDVRDIRAWLGASPITGQLHIPAGDASRLYTETGTPGYQIDDLLIDLDLFRRLRARGQARGADGLEDLTTALALVTGEPFTRTPGQGWSWLYDDDRLHETIAAAIVDTAHLVVTRSLATSDTATARSAAETAGTAVPFDEVSRLDRVKIALAEGHTAIADEILDTEVFNRTDDYVGPIDPPERTKKITSRSGWQTRRSS